MLYSLTQPLNHSSLILTLVKHKWLLSSYSRLLHLSSVPPHTNTVSVQ